MTCLEKENKAFIALIVCVSDFVVCLFCFVEGIYEVFSLRLVREDLEGVD